MTRGTNPFPPAPLPSEARPTAIAVVIIVVVSFIAHGFDAAVAVSLTGLLGWVTGLMHERSAWR